jgi:hypothetical protein
MSPSLNITITPHDIERIHKHSLDLLERVGSGGSLLTQRETRETTRREYVPASPPAGHAVLEIARAETLEILTSHKLPPLLDGASAKIETIVAEADVNLREL